MHSKNLSEIKTMSLEALKSKASKLREEIQTLILEKNMGSLKDIKSIAKKRKSLAQILTTIKQKESLL